MIVGDLGKLIVAKGFEKVAQSPINRPIWSHWLPYSKAQCTSSSVGKDRV